MTMHQMQPSRLGTGLIAALITAFAAGCMSLEPVSDTTRYYTLQTPAAESAGPAAQAANAPSVGVRVVSLASHLKRPAMAVRVSANEVRYAEGQRWADRMDESVARGLAAGLQSRLGSKAAVSVAPAVRSARPQLIIEIGLDAFEGRSASPQAALLVADWRIRSGADGSVIASGRFHTDKAGWNGSDYGQLAGLLGAAVDDMAGALASEVSAALER